MAAFSRIFNQNRNVFMVFQHNMDPVQNGRSSALGECQNNFSRLLKFFDVIKFSSFRIIVCYFCIFLFMVNLIVMLYSYSFNCKKASLVYQSGFIDTYVESLFNKSAIHEVKSCRNAAKLNKPRWKLIKVRISLCFEGNLKLVF